MNEILFVTAQPDVPYFIWQIKLYVHNFIEKGIDPKQIHVVLGIVNNAQKPSKESLKLKEFGINVHHFTDFRRKKHYIPSIKPYLISNWLNTNPDYGKLFFLHDADIIFNELPSFDRLLNDDICYLSDTVGYIGYDYIIDCCKRYENHHPSSEKNQLLNEMASVIGLDVELIKENTAHIYAADILTYIEPKDEMVEYYNHAVNDEDLKYASESSIRPSLFEDDEEPTDEELDEEELQEIIEERNKSKVH